MSIVLIALWLLHPAVLGECVLALETLRVGEREYVAADLSVETSDPAYATTRSLALVLLCTYVPFFPCCVFGALYRHREHLRSKEAISRAPAWVRQRLYYFYGSFKPEFFLWEGVGFVHKALLAAHLANVTLVLPGWYTNYDSVHGRFGGTNGLGQVGGLLIVLQLGEIQNPRFGAVAVGPDVLHQLHEVQRHGLTIE